MAERGPYLFSAILRFWYLPFGAVSGKDGREGASSCLMLCIRRLVSMCPSRGKTQAATRGGSKSHPLHISSPPPPPPPPPPRWKGWEGGGPRPNPRRYATEGLGLDGRGERIQQSSKHTGRAESLKMLSCGVKWSNLSKSERAGKSANEGDK